MTQTKELLLEMENLHRSFSKMKDCGKDLRDASRQFRKAWREPTSVMKAPKRSIREFSLSLSRYIFDILVQVAQSGTSRLFSGMTLPPFQVKFGERVVSVRQTGAIEISWDLNPLSSDLLLSIPIELEVEAQPKRALMFDLPIQLIVGAQKNRINQVQAGEGRFSDSSDGSPTDPFADIPIAARLKSRKEFRTILAEKMANFSIDVGGQVASSFDPNFEAASVALRSALVISNQVDRGFKKPVSMVPKNIPPKFHTAVTIGPALLQRKVEKRFHDREATIEKFEIERGYVKWSGKFGQRAKVYPTRTNGYENDEATEFFR